MPGPGHAPALVFGAAGFVGRWVVRELSRLRLPVVAAVRDLQGATGILARWDGVADLVPVDLAQPGAAAQLVSRHAPSVVFNLAGYGVDPGERDDARAERLNHELVRELAEACAEGARPVLVHAGSALEYGTVTGVLREDGPANPTTLYGRSKLAGTHALAEAARRLGTRGITARLFTVFGDGEHEGRLFPSLLAASRAAAPLDLSAGQQRRDFTFAEDVAGALVRLPACGFQPGEVVNLASGRLHTVEAFVRAVADVLGIPAERLRFGALPTRPEEMWHAGVAVDRVTALLGAPLPGDVAALVARAARDAAARAVRR